MAQSEAVLSSAAQAPHSNGRAWPPWRRALSCFVICFCDLFAEGRELRSIKPQSVGQWTIAVGTPLVPTPQLPSDFSPSGCGRPWDSSGRWYGRISPGAGAAPGALLRPRLWGRRLPARGAPAVTCPRGAQLREGVGTLPAGVSPSLSSSPAEDLFLSACLRFCLRGAQTETLGQVNTQVGAPGWPWELRRWRELSEGHGGGGSRFRSGGVSALEGQGPADMVGIKVLFLQEHPPPCCPTLSQVAWLLPLSFPREALAGGLGWGSPERGAGPQ